MPKVTANDITINELILAYLPHAERYYRNSRELEDVKISLRPLKALYGLKLAKSFGPLMLKAVRDQMIRQPIVRKIKVVDPSTGKEHILFSCYNQDQPMDSVDFNNLAARLRANTVQEKLTNLWLDKLLAERDVRRV